MNNYLFYSLYGDNNWRLFLSMCGDCQLAIAPHLYCCLNLKFKNIKIINIVLSLMETRVGPLKILFLKYEMQNVILAWDNLATQGQ